MSSFGQRFRPFVHKLFGGIHGGQVAGVVFEAVAQQGDGDRVVRRRRVGKAVQGQGADGIGVRVEEVAAFGEGVSAKEISPLPAGRQRRQGGRVKAEDRKSVV